MNLAVQGIDADIRWNNEGSFHRDELPDLKADFILANPPFNISDWGGERLTRRRALEVRHAARRQRQLRLAPAHPAPPGAARHGGRGAGQRLDVLAAVRRRRHPQGHDRGGRGRLHGRAAGAALLLDADSGLPVDSWRETRAPTAIATGAARSCSSTPASSATWSIGSAKEFRPTTSPGSPETYHRWRNKNRRGAMRTSRASARRRPSRSSRAWACAHARPLCRRGVTSRMTVSRSPNTSRGFARISLSSLRKVAPREMRSSELSLVAIRS